MIKYYKPELSSGKLLDLLIKASSKESAILNCTYWLKQQDSKTKLFFCGTEFPIISDAREIKEELFGVLIY